MIQWAWRYWALEENVCLCSQLSFATKFIKIDAKLAKFIFNFLKYLKIGVAKF